MIFYKDSPPTNVTLLLRHAILATLLAAPFACQAALQSPRRPASASAQLGPASPSSSRQTLGKRSNRLYLAMVGPSVLTFADAESPLPPEPVMPELPKPAPVKTKTPDNKTSAQATHETGTSVNKNPESQTPDTTAQGQPTSDNPKPVSLLPDDTRSEIRPEDVLPFFQYPGSPASGDAPSVIINQAPSSAPPSTATYRLQ